MGELGLGIEPLLQHSLCELPDNPTLRHYSLYELDLAENELVMLAEGRSFGNNVSLDFAAIIPRADGSFLIMQHDSFRIIKVTPYPPEG